MTRMLTRRLLIAACLMGMALSASANAPGFAPAPRAKPSITAPTGSDLISRANLPGTVAFAVIDLATGQMLEAFQPDLPLPPASVAKIPTALYALEALGPDHRFETRLVAVGPIEDGVLKGDLILQGGGDPEVDTAALDLLAYRAVSGGLRKVEGQFLVDDSLIPAIDRIDHTQPEIASYNPSISGLNLNFNRVYAEWKPRGGQVNMNVQARSDTLSPPTDAVTIEVVDQTPNGRIFHFQGDFPKELWKVRRNALRKAGSRWLPVRQPALYSGSVFQRLARDAGLNLSNAVPGQAPLVADIAARIESRRLADILTDMLRYSTNLTAEVTGMGATRTVVGSASSLLASGQAMSAWAGTFAGFAPGDPGFVLTNHSGLSGDARTSARRLVELLAAADRRGFPSLSGGRGATLKALLPRKRYDDEDARAPEVEATMRAKTGTLNFVSALAGYIDTDAGKRLGFAIITADLPRRNAITDTTIERPSGSRAWANRSRRLQRALVRSWINRFGTLPNQP
ncbi:MAG: D-alanyl-D-alanine carboxypeptidase/D-alanyl-D-alanine-endopeptidase [Pseudomonadota bacterium]